VFHTRSALYNWSSCLRCCSWRCFRTFASFRSTHSSNHSNFYFHINTAANCNSFYRGKVTKMLQFTANISQQCYNMESQYHTESCRPNTGKQTSNNKLTFTAKTPTWLNTKFNQSQQYQSFTLYKSIYSTPPSDICTVMQNKGDINRTLPCYTVYHNCTHWYTHNHLTASFPGQPGWAGTR